MLRQFLLKGSELRRNESSRFPIFAFRLHQFFTRGDTVWATIEREAERHLEMSKKGSKPGEPDKPLFPLVFCRQCGTAYYRVKLVSRMSHGKALRLERTAARKTTTAAAMPTSMSPRLRLGRGRRDRCCWTACLHS